MRAQSLIGNHAFPDSLSPLTVQVDIRLINLWWVKRKEACFLVHPNLFQCFVHDCTYQSDTFVFTFPCGLTWRSIKLFHSWNLLPLVFAWGRQILFLKNLLPVYRDIPVKGAQEINVMHLFIVCKTVRFKHCMTVDYALISCAYVENLSNLSSCRCFLSDLPYISKTVMLYYIPVQKLYTRLGWLRESTDSLISWGKEQIHK